MWDARRRAAMRSARSSMAERTELRSPVARLRAGDTRGLGGAALPSKLYRALARRSLRVCVCVVEERS